MPLKQYKDIIKECMLLDLYISIIGVVVYNKKRKLEHQVVFIEKVQLAFRLTTITLTQVFSKKERNFQENCVLIRF